MAGEGDFLRTRLTHSLEVAQIGKGLALRLGADPDLVEAVALLHDIGHPPFGHAGEDALKELMKPYGGFEANGQNLRIVTRLETKSEKYSGLNLTRAVIDGQMKYKHPFEVGRRKFIYEDDIELMQWARDQAVEIVPGYDLHWKSFECDIMDWADDVAYAVHDLEDGIHSGMIDASLFHQNRRYEEAIGAVHDEFKNCPVDVRNVYNDLMQMIRPGFWEIEQYRMDGDYKKQKAIRKQLTSHLINRYITCTVRLERASPPKDSVSMRYFYRVGVPIKYRVEVDVINKLIWKHVIESAQVRTLEEKGKHIVRSLFDKFMFGEDSRLMFPDDWKPYLPNENDKDYKRKKARVVGDYIAGMTDSYAQGLFSKLFLPNAGSIHDAL